jgi:sugar phosphate isomerase/epimerase
VNLSRRTLLAALSAVQATAQTRQRVPNWRPKLGVLAQYSDSNLAWVKAEGFTSMQLRIEPAKVDDNAIASIKQKISASGIYVSSLACDGNHIDPDPAKRQKQNEYTVACIELCGKLGIPNIGGQSGKIAGQPLQQQVDEIVRVYNEKYFKACEKNNVRILWEPYFNGPNIGTSPVGWEALFKAFKDPVAAAREFVDKIYDVHLKDCEILWHLVKRGGIEPVNNANWHRWRVPGNGSVDWKGFFAVLAEAGYQGAMNIENEDNFYYPAYNNNEFTEQYKRGFRVAHEFLKTLVPPLTA